MMLLQKKQLSFEIRKALGNVNWLIGGQAIILAINFFSTIILARKLGAEQFGHLNFLLAWAGLMVPFCTMGLLGILTKQYHDEPKSIPQILGTALLIRSAGAVLGALILITAYYFLSSTNDTQSILLLIFVAYIFTAAGAARPWFEAQVAIAPVVVMEVIIRFSAAIGKIYFAITMQSWEAVLLIFAVEIALVGIMPLILLFFRFRFFIPAIDFARIGGMLKSGLLLFFGGVASVIYLKTDMIMLGLLQNAKEVGYYAAAIKFSQIWLFLPGTIVASFFPWLLDARKQDKALYYERLQKLSRMLLLISVAISLSFTVIAYPLVDVVYGKNYSQAVPILIIHIWSLLFAFQLTLVHRWVIIEKVYYLAFFSHLAGALINIGANLILIPHFSGIGASIATLFSYLFAGYLFLFFFTNTYDIRNVLTQSFFTKTS